MDEVLKFLTDNKVFYLATVNGDAPALRPFGFAMKYDNKLYFCTANTKNVYKQLKANSKMQISATSPEGKWLRLNGKAVFNTSKESQEAVLNTMPMLKNMYKVGDPTFETFYIDQADATFYDMQGNSHNVKF
ncbi:pyridoxamine 5'-phosphate oxidase family protein [Clostridium sp. AWRP]|uniref:pyridoxamine 5'-phosphate oxidase family protein n=1 Tax=Clostridium sp. AWRP TaxID=2212991 RepID=UPI000FDBCDFC|nr:pyridoxamine 5'-phosphate oxidase family protein [Clostridium sp. AWRP]AZV56378.1 pyridoxamine 5-phosphate oxidase [Clostridium sp. AWRP]